LLKLLQILQYSSCVIDGNHPTYHKSHIVVKIHNFSPPSQSPLLPCTRQPVKFAL